MKGFSDFLADVEVLVLMSPRSTAAAAKQRFHG
jgi:hypothetical protein